MVQRDGIIAQETEVFPGEVADTLLMSKGKNYSDVKTQKGNTELINFPGFYAKQVFKLSCVVFFLFSHA